MVRYYPVDVLGLPQGIVTSVVGPSKSALYIESEQLHPSLSIRTEAIHFLHGLKESEGFA